MFVGDYYSLKEATRFRLISFSRWSNTIREPEELLLTHYQIKKLKFDKIKPPLVK